VQAFGEQGVGGQNMGELFEGHRFPCCPTIRLYKDILRWDLHTHTHNGVSDYLSQVEKVYISMFLDINIHHIVWEAAEVE